MRGDADAGQQGSRAQAREQHSSRRLAAADRTFALCNRDCTGSCSRSPVTPARADNAHRWHFFFPLSFFCCVFACVGGGGQGEGGEGGRKLQEKRECVWEENGGRSKGKVASRSALQVAPVPLPYGTILLITTVVLQYSTTVLEAPLVL